MLFKAIYDPQDGDILQWWPDGAKPKIAFIEVGYDVEGLCEKLLAALTETLEALYTVHPQLRTCEDDSLRVMATGGLVTPTAALKARAAIALAETERASP